MNDRPNRTDQGTRPFRHPGRLTSARLTFRRPVSSDADWLAILANNPGVAHMVASMPHPYSRTHAETYLARAVTDFDLNFAIETTDTATPIGIIGIIGKHGTRAELGYWLGEPYWGHGYASEAAQAMIEFAFRDTDLITLFACHFLDNQASARILQKLGFRYTGVQRWRKCIGRGVDVEFKEMELIRPPQAHEETRENA